MISHVERAATRNLDAPVPRAPKLPRPPSIRAWRAPNSRPALSRPANLRETETSMPKLVVTARSVKLTVPLDAADMAAMPVPEGRAKFAVNYEGGMLEADVASKSLRKAQGVIREHGPDNTFVMLQGKLGRGGEILECGLVAQVKKTCAPAAAPLAELPKAQAPKAQVKGA
jgi:hypothetical protein